MLKTLMNVFNIKQRGECVSVKTLTQRSAYWLELGLAAPDLEMVVGLIRLNQSTETQFIISLKQNIKVQL